MFNVTFTEMTTPNRSYSFVADWKLPVGEWNIMDAVPDEIVGVLESVVQSDTCPAFLLQGGNVVVVKVTEA